MHTFAPQQKPTQQATAALSAKTGWSFSGQGRELPNREEVAAGLSGSAALRLGHDFSRIPLHSPVAGAVQPKLAINKAGDEFEQEADRISAQVMRKSEPQLQRSACACGGACSKCQSVQAGHDHERVQTRSIGSGDARQSAAPPLVHEVLRAPGQPLDASTRAFMEPRFGHDFSHVRVHTDESAAESARAINAHAYTLGNNIVFGHGRFDADGTEGRRLLAHELTHVIQQSAGHAPRAVARQTADADPPEKGEPKAQAPAPPKPGKCVTGCAQRWGKDTTCSRWGFQVGAHEHAPQSILRGGKAKKVKDLFIPCCDSWPFTLEQYARDTLGLSGAASCTAAHGKEIATVSLLFSRGKKVEGNAIKVLCSDTIPTGGAGAHYEPKPVSANACSDKTFATDKREVIEVSPKAMEDLAGTGGINDRQAVSVCYSGSKEDLCDHNGPGKGRNPEHKHCFTKGCTPAEDIPTLDETGWPR